jgi:NTE family protein
MALSAADFQSVAAPAVASMRAQGLDQKHYSDALDAAGRQYVDLVMEGGGVLGIALAGYIYLLEQAGLRFSALGGASAGSITALVLAALDEPSAAKADRLVEVVANIPMASFMDGKDERDDDARDFINTMLQRPGLAENVFTNSQGPRWSAIGMSGRFGCAAWAHAHASRQSVQSPDFDPTLRAVVFAGGLRRCGACG